MLVIRREQMTALSNARRVRFRAKLVPHLQDELRSGGVIPDSEWIRQQVDTGMERAGTFGFSSEMHIAEGSVAKFDGFSLVA